MSPTFAVIVLGEKSNCYAVIVNSFTLPDVTVVAVSVFLVPQPANKNRLETINIARIVIGFCMIPPLLQGLNRNIIK